MRNEEPKYVQVRVRQAEKRRWVEAARHLDLTVAQLVRRAVRAYTKCRATGCNDGTEGGGPATDAGPAKAEVRS